MKIRVKLVLLGLLALGCGCTDADWKQKTAYGTRHRVTLYSGGKPVQEWVSTGKVENEDKSDGFYFVDSKTKKLVRVTGDVVIEQE